MKTEITPVFSSEEILNTLSIDFGLSGELKALESYRDQNLFLRASDNSCFVVKISNAAESGLELEMQNAAMLHLIQNSIPVPTAIANKSGGLVSSISDSSQQSFSFRVLTFIKGKFYADLDGDAKCKKLWDNLGNFVARIDTAMMDFQHQGAYRYLEWDLAHGFGVCQSKKQFLDESQTLLIDYFLSIYETQTLPLLAKLPQGVIHNDINDNNILVDEHHNISGLIDFGDMVFSHRVNELAIACAYALMEQNNPIETMIAIVASYFQVKPLTDIELEVLYSLVSLRLCVSVCCSAAAIKKEPNNQYLLISAKPAWRLLQQLKVSNAFSVLCQLRHACHLPIDDGSSSEDIITYRKKHLGKSLSLSYQQPLKIVRGQGCYLYDEKGNAYLDMVNNVCHVGHCHPKVVAAGQQQMAKLNTNTRYLHDNIVNFSKKLLVTMPEKLSVCMLVNSGSEANELAFRLARNFTKSKQLLVVDGAYHGNTNACIEASPYKFNGKGGAGAQDYISIVSLPDPYRGEHQGNSLKTANAYANSVTQAIEGINAKGEKVGAFICESLQGVGGQIIMPDGYLKSVYEKVRAAGGVCIADEVQVGFGRVGTHMWAFETQDVVPDIVTLGKPIGNGHPMAAVIMTQEIADAFVTGMEFFNTFGGNPVSCAIGEAVLEVIETQQLQQHALDVGLYFREELKKLQNNFDLIGDVRGLGLFIGVELVEDRHTKLPATEKASWMIEFFKQNKILLSTEGQFYNILKIKPPIVFNQNDADKFISVLKMALLVLDSSIEQKEF